MRHGTSSPARALLAVPLAVVLAPFAATASHASARAGEVKVEGTVDNKFDPADVTATPDAAGKVTIAFTSHGAHTYQSDDVKGLDSGPVNDGQTKTITFTAKPGKYNVYCLYHKSIGMVGTLTVGKAGGDTKESPSAAPSSQPPASASASASVAAPDDNAPTAGASDDAGETETEGNVPGVTGNKSLERIAAERAAEKGAVSGFKFFTMVCVAFLVILGVAVLFSTRPRRTGR